MEITVEIKLTAILSGGDLHLHTMKLDSLNFRENKELQTIYKQAKLEANKHNFKLDIDCEDEVFANIEIKSEVSNKESLEYALNDFLDSLQD